MRMTACTTITHNCRRRDAAERAASVGKHVVSTFDRAFGCSMGGYFSVRAASQPIVENCISRSSLLASLEADLNGVNNILRFWPR